MPVTELITCFDPLPCPFCGKTVAVRSWRDAGLWTKVYCVDCGVEMRKNLMPGDAVAAWNRRSPAKEPA